MKLDKDTLQKWKDDAKKATQNKWRLDYSCGVAEIFLDDDPGSFELYTSDENAKHIANACPQNFIALIEKLERYEKALKFYANENHFNHLSVLFDCDAEGIQCGGGFAVVDDGIIEKGRVAQEALND